MIHSHGPGFIPAIAVLGIVVEGTDVINDALVDDAMIIVVIDDSVDIFIVDVVVSDTIEVMVYIELD